MRLRRVGEIALGIWLFVVLADYFGLLELPGIVADLAAATLLVVIASMIWKYFIRRENAHG